VLKKFIYVVCFCVASGMAQASMVGVEDDDEVAPEGTVAVVADVVDDEAFGFSPEDALNERVVESVGKALVDLEGDPLDGTLAESEAEPVKEVDSSDGFFFVVLATVSFLGLIVLLMLYRSGKSRGQVLDQPRSWDEIRVVVRDTMRRFGRKVYGRAVFGETPLFSIFESECRRKWVITERTDKVFDRHAWLVSVNYACTHFEVHHREDRRLCIRTENLSSEALFDALMQAREYGPFRVKHALNEQWVRMDAR
jgi:hypothetical protein